MNVLVCPRRFVARTAETQGLLVFCVGNRPRGSFSISTNLSLRYPRPASGRTLDLKLCAVGTLLPLTLAWRHIHLAAILVPYWGRRCACICTLRGTLALTSCCGVPGRRHPHIFLVDFVQRPASRGAVLSAFLSLPIPQTMLRLQGTRLHCARLRLGSAVAPVCRSVRPAPGRRRQGVRLRHLYHLLFHPPCPLRCPALNWRSRQPRMQSA